MTSIYVISYASGAQGGFFIVEDDDQRQIDQIHAKARRFGAVVGQIPVIADHRANPDKIDQAADVLPEPIRALPPEVAEPVEPTPIEQPARVVEASIVEAQSGRKD